jgi:hypothetical protein
MNVLLRILASLKLAVGLLAVVLVVLAAGSIVTVETLRRLPVQHDGRVMPLDTLAREAVKNITGSSSLHGEDQVETIAQ